MQNNMIRNSEVKKKRGLFHSLTVAALQHHFANLAGGSTGSR